MIAQLGLLGLFGGVIALAGILIGLFGRLILTVLKIGIEEEA